MVLSVAVACFPVYVRPDGLRSYNFFGLYRTLRWNDIADIQQESLLVLRYLVVTSESGWRQVWVPLYLSDMPGFAHRRRSRVESGHPLGDELEQFDAEPDAAAVGGA